MFSLKHLVLASFAFFTVAHSQQFQIQNWVRDPWITFEMMSETRC